MEENDRARRAGTALGIGDLWVGYSDTDSEGLFTWIDGTVGGYNRFQSGEPNGGTNENCALMFRFPDAQWIDVGCAGPFAFLCE